MGKYQDLAGKRFGRLLALYRTSDSPAGAIRYYCVCDCGNSKIVQAGNLRTGHTKSCGCWHDESSSERGTARHYRTHGMTGTRLYRIWRGMKVRCLNENLQSYRYYGAKGVSVCDEWLCSFESFMSWALANGYDDTLTIDRIDSDLDYSPKNCRWATAKQQQNNRTNTLMLSFNGKTKSLSEWADEIGIMRNTLSERLRRGWSVEQTLNTPLHGERYGSCSNDI